MKRRTGLHVVIAGLALSIFGGHALAATTCNTGSAPNPPLSGTVRGGVVVNAGDFCVIAGANVSGGVRVNAGGVLIVCGSTINGGLISNGAAEVVFGAEEIDCAGDVVNGAIQISNTGTGIFAPAPAVALERSTLNGGVYLRGNKGPIAIASNTISGALVCSNNAFDLEDEGSPSIITGAVRCTFGEGE
jgi:hypothetical protein